MTFQRAAMASLATLGLGALATGAAQWIWPVGPQPLRGLLRRLFSCRQQPWPSHRHPRRLRFSHRVRDLLLWRPYLPPSRLDERVGLSPGAFLPASRRDPSSGRGVFYPLAQPQQLQTR